MNYKKEYWWVKIDVHKILSNITIVCKLDNGKKYEYYEIGSHVPVEYNRIIFIQRIPNYEDKYG
jgi:hypothetical protein